MIEGVIYRYKSPSGKYYIGQTTDEKNRHISFNSNKKNFLRIYFYFKNINILFWPKAHYKSKNKN